MGVSNWDTTEPLQPVGKLLKFSEMKTLKTRQCLRSWLSKLCMGPRYITSQSTSIQEIISHLKIVTFVHFQHSLRWTYKVQEKTVYSSRPCMWNVLHTLSIFEHGTPSWQCFLERHRTSLVGHCWGVYTTVHALHSFMTWSHSQFSLSPFVSQSLSRCPCLRPSLHFSVSSLSVSLPVSRQPMPCERLASCLCYMPPLPWQTVPRMEL